jgi:predicted DNA-binding protein (UPF0278 family)
MEKELVKECAQRQSQKNFRKGTKLNRYSIDVPSTFFIVYILKFRRDSSEALAMSSEKVGEARALLAPPPPTPHCCLFFPCSAAPFLLL